MTEEISEDLTVRFCVAGAPAFICGVNGPATLDCLRAIEKEAVDYADEMDYWDQGDGIYEVRCIYQKPQVGEHGRVEIEGRWEFDDVKFHPHEECEHESV